MPQPRLTICRVHDDGECQCYKAPAVAAQSLEELDYLKSACSAAQQGNCTRLQGILDKHPEALSSDGTQGGSGYTPLHYASRAGHLDAVRLLLARGADPNLATKAGGATALHRACYMGHEAVAELLLQHGADALTPDADGNTALHKAARQGHLQLFQTLHAKSPAAASIQNKKGLTASELIAPP